MEDLGQQLRRHREARKITLEEISDWTKINLSYLEDLEAGRFDRLPAPVFALGFLKQYARCVGLDPEEVVSLYRFALRKEVGSTEPKTSEKAGWPRKRAVLILAAVVCGFILLWVFLYPHAPPNGERVRSIRLPRTSGEDSRKEQLKRELDLQAGFHAALTPEGGPNLPPALTGGPGEKGERGRVEGLPVALTVQALRKTWVQVTVDDTLPTQQNLEAGDQLSYQAEQRIQLNIGNGDGVRIFFDGRVFENLGEKDEVVHILFPPPES